MFDALRDACPLKPEKVAGGLDLLVVRELTGGIYFGERGTKETADMGLAAYDVEQYAEKEVAVSYTHLDVYKRQELYKNIIIANNAGCI